MIIIIIMSMGWDYVYEVRPPISLLFISRWYWVWGTIVKWFDRGKLLIRPPDLCSNPTSTVIYHRFRRNLTEKITNLAFQISFVILRSEFLQALKSYDMGPPSLPSLRRKACCGFLSPLKIHRLFWAWACEPWGQMASTLNTRPPRTTLFVSCSASKFLSLTQQSRLKYKLI
jgi:hypothetical protein